MEGAWRRMQFVVVVAAVITAVTAKTITVGDGTGWGLGTNYAQWVANQSIHVGDTLVFGFTAGAHDVAPVTKAEYDGCNTSTAATNSLKQPPVSIPVNSTAPLYFLCTFTGHCAGGQKLAVTPTGSTPNARAPAPQSSKAGRTPPPSPSPSPSAVASPPSSSSATPPSDGAEVPPPAASSSPATPASGPSTGGGAATPPSPAGSSAPSLTGATGFAAAFLSTAAVAALI